MERGNGSKTTQAKIRNIVVGVSSIEHAKETFERFRNMT